MKRKLLSILFIILIVLLSCTKKAESPYSPDIPKPKADVRIELSVDQFVFIYDPAGYYWSIFNVVLSEHNGVQCSISTVVLKFKDGTTLVATVTYSGGTLPANGYLNVECSPVVWYYFDIITITVSGQDVNGNSILVSHDYSGGTTATGASSN